MPGQELLRTLPLGGRAGGTILLLLPQRRACFRRFCFPLRLFRNCNGRANPVGSGGWGDSHPRGSRRFRNLDYLSLATATGLFGQTDRAEEQKPVAGTRQGYVEAIRQADVRLHRMEPDLRQRQGLKDEARQILIKQIPGPGVEDYRGFEWYYLWKLAQPQNPLPVFKSQRG